MKNAFITGGGSGLGNEIAVHLRNLGYRIGITYHKSAINHNNFDFATQIDLTTKPITDPLSDFISKFGNIDIFVHNASIFQLETIDSPDISFTSNFNIHAKVTLDSIHHIYHHNKVKNLQTQYVSILDGEIISRKPQIPLDYSDSIEMQINLRPTKFLSYYITKRVIIDIISATSNDVNPYVIFKSLFPVQIDGLESDVCERTKKGHGLADILSAFP